MTTYPIKVVSRKDGSLKIDTVDAGEKCIGIIDDALEVMGTMVEKVERDLTVDVGNSSAPEDVHLAQH